MKYCMSHVGTQFTTNEGYTGTVVDGGDTKGTVIIEIEGWQKEVQPNQYKKGKIRYPYHKSVYKVGLIGEGKYGTKGKHKKMYSTWSAMLARIHDPATQAKHPAYKDVTICEEWYNYQNFCVWMENSNYQEGWHMDKDLLSTDSKIYSESTCIFIPPALNNFLANRKPKSTNLPTGVRERRAGRFTAEIRSIIVEGEKKSLGTFPTIEEASKAYQEARTIEADKLREFYKNILPLSALEAIR